MVKLSHFLKLKNKIDKDVKAAIDRIDEAVAATGNGDIDWSSAPRAAADGTPGKDGKDGKDGATGARGLPGERGKDGKDGTQGAVGATGASGLPGACGRDGVDGRAGADGKDGEDGLQGVSVVDADIAFDNHLVLTLSDGSQIDCGDLMSEQTIQHITSSTTVRTGGGGGEGGGHIIYNDGAALAQVAGLNFTGTGVSVQNVGDKSTVTITGSGATGPQGPQGPAGADGAKGDQGDQGIQGIQGIQGDAGADGADGDQGIQGIQGIQGDAGADGADGDQGIQGIQGIQGAAGADGADGDQGIQGIQGDAGADGADGINGTDGARWFSGQGSPSSGIGSTGDYYLDGATGNVWVRTGSNWLPSGENIKGPAGDDGADGEGVPVGGTAGQVLAKASGTNYDTEWVAAGGGGGDVSVENEGTEVEAAAATINFVGDGVVATGASGEATITIDGGTTVSSLDAADALTGAELVPIVQTGTGVKATLLEVAGTPVQKLVGFDGNSFGMASMLMNCPDGFSASDGDLYGIEPLICLTDLTGTLIKSTQTVFNYGVAKLSTGTNVAGSAALKTTAGAFLFVEGTSYMDMGFRGMHDGVNDTTDRYTVRYGWHRGLSGAVFDQGIYIEHRWDEANYMAVVKGTGAAVEVDTGVVATQWGVAGVFSDMPTFRIIYDGPGTGDATFYINGTLVATIDTSSSSITSLADVGVQLAKSDGNATRHLFVDSITLNAVLDTQMGDFL